LWPHPGLWRSSLSLTVNQTTGGLLAGLVSPAIPAFGKASNGSAKSTSSLTSSGKPLISKDLATLTPEERQDYIASWTCSYRSFPDAGRLLPMRLGNILRSAEDRCALKYGLDADYLLAEAVVSAAGCREDGAIGGAISV
jgi:hypothetical protein